MGFAIGAVLAGSATDPCCCEPEECCLYPATALQTSQILFADLPASLDLTASGTIYSGATLSDVGGEFWYTHPSFDGGGTPLLRWDGGSDWIWNNDLGSGNSLCLIFDQSPEFLSEDQFPDILTLTFTESGVTNIEITLTRDDLCTWSGTDPGTGTPATLFYDEFFKWSLFIAATSGGVITQKDNPQSSPEGTFMDGGDLTNILVSP